MTLNFELLDKDLRSAELDDVTLSQSVPTSEVLVGTFIAEVEPQCVHVKLCLSHLSARTVANIIIEPMLAISLANDSS